MTTTPSKDQVSLLEIADWQINAGARNTKVDLPALQRGFVWKFHQVEALNVDLPALQRGFVWKFHQVEALWDSLIRGIPIGSFLLAEYNKYNKYKREQGRPNQETPPDYFLLDGQQRATAIGLGFAPVWEEPVIPDQKQAKNILALWVDLAPPDPGDDQVFKFRLLTRSHPWGYKRKRDGSDRLPAGERHSALEVYTKALLAYKTATGFPGQLPEYPRLPVRCAWPWDAGLPIPFPLLARAVRDSGAEAALDQLQKEVKADPFWRECVEMPTKSSGCWKSRLLDVLAGKGSQNQENKVYYDRLTDLARRVAKIKDSTFPLLYVPESDELPAGATSELPPSLLELSFVRVNTQGTRLEGEELTYSVFKAILPDCKKLVEKIGEKAHIRPSRLISLVGRLVLADQSKRSKDAPLPQTLEVNEFRKKIQDGDGREKIKRFIDHEAEALFNKASKLLVEGLGRILAADLAQRAPNLYFLLLSAIKEDSAKIDLADAGTCKKILAVLTAVAWFSPDPSEAVRRLWANKIEWWKGATNLFRQEVMDLKNDYSVVIYPLPEPNVLKSALGKMMTERVLDGQGRITQRNLAPGRAWEWALRAGGATASDNLALDQKPISGLKFALYQTSQISAANDEDKKRLQEEAWQKFWNTVTKDKRLVLFAQRKFLERKFHDYEPGAPDQIEDSDRPYDWDHILPYSHFGSDNYFRGIWKYWGECNGNFRAWPLAGNRSDGDKPPAKKLSDDDIEDSAIGNLESWHQIGEKSDEIKNSLKGKDAGEIGVKVLQAITGRLVALYGHWYKELDLESTLGAEPAALYSQDGPAE